MSARFVAYIDEAGDEGFGKLAGPSSGGQSHWLSIGALIVSDENDREVAAWRNEIISQFPQKRTRDLHFRYLNHSQRIAACRLLSKKPVGISVVCSNKITITNHPKKDFFKVKGHLYNYLVRFLLERVTGACARAARRDSHNASAALRVIFSRRGGTDYHSMKDYLLLMRDGREVMPSQASINWGVLDPNDISVVNHAQSAGLQLADVVTSATANALEPDAYGNPEPRYALELRSRFIRLNGRVANSGLTVLPKPSMNPMSDDQKRFLSDMEEKVRAPGS